MTTVGDDGPSDVAPDVSQPGASSPAVAAADGIGVPPAAPIATLPPLEVNHKGIPVSPRTGEPRRSGVLAANQGLLYAAAAAAGLGYARYWWIAMHVEHFFVSAWVVGWLQPRPGGAGSVWLVIGLAACVAAMVTAPAMTAYQAWTGQRFSRRLGIVAMGVSLLGVLINPLTFLAIPFTAVGLGLLWHPALTRYFDQWETLRTNPEPHSTPTAGQVFYGRLPRFE